MKIIITESQLKELNYGIHSAMRTFERVDVPSYQVILTYNTGTEKIKKIVGDYIITDKIRYGIDYQLRKLDDTTFPKDVSFGVIIYDYHLEDLNRITFTDKITKIYVKKVLEQFPNSKLSLFASPNKESEKEPCGGFLIGIVRENKLITLYHLDKERINKEKLRVDKIITL